jgi:hypothetical protein
MLLLPQPVSSPVLSPLSEDQITDGGPANLPAGPLGYVSRIEIAGEHEEPEGLRGVLFPCHFLPTSPSLLAMCVFSLPYPLFVHLVF